jgi:hypothetical protein
MLKNTYDHLLIKVKIAKPTRYYLHVWAFQQLN